LPTSASLERILMADSTGLVAFNYSLAIHFTGTTALEVNFSDGGRFAPQRHAPFQH
jgi:hypothetical protein